MQNLLWFSCSVVSYSSWSHGLQHDRLPWPSLSPRVWSNSYPLSQWCHLTISSSVAPFSSCPQSFLASGSFPMSQLFVSGGQSIGASAAASVLPMNIQGRFSLEWTGLGSAVYWQSKPVVFALCPQARVCDEQLLINWGLIRSSFASSRWLILSGFCLGLTPPSPKDAGPGKLVSFNSVPLGGWLMSLGPAREIVLLWLMGEVSLPLSVPHWSSF